MAARCPSQNQPGVDCSSCSRAARAPASPPRSGCSPNTCVSKGGTWSRPASRAPHTLGRRIRQLLLDSDETESPSPRAEALLYAADRAHHVATVVRPALKQGAVVISDRYIDSSLAYQGAGRTLPTDELAWLSAWATGRLKPDLVVLLDVPPEVGIARVEGRRRGIDRLERESLAFHERVRYAFLDLAEEDPRRYLVVDATRPVEEVAEAVLERVTPMLPPTEQQPRPDIPQQELRTVAASHHPEGQRR